MRCPRDLSLMVRGSVFSPTVVFSGDFFGEESVMLTHNTPIPPYLVGRTANPGPGVLTTCWKCPTCGHSEV